MSADSDIKKIKEAPTYYDIFDVTVATFDETVVRKAYRKLALRLHPDKNGNSDQAKREFQDLQERYESLKERAHQVRKCQELPGFTSTHFN